MIIHLLPLVSIRRSEEPVLKTASGWTCMLVKFIVIIIIIIFIVMLIKIREQKLRAVNWRYFYFFKLLQTNSVITLIYYYYCNYYNCITIIIAIIDKIIIFKHTTMATNWIQHYFCVRFLFPVPHNFYKVKIIKLCIIITN